MDRGPEGDVCLFGPGGGVLQDSIHRQIAGEPGCLRFLLPEYVCQQILHGRVVPVLTQAVKSRKLMADLVIDFCPLRHSVFQKLVAFRHAFIFQQQTQRLNLLFHKGAQYAEGGDNGGRQGEPERNPVKQAAEYACLQLGKQTGGVSDKSAACRCGYQAGSQESGRAPGSRNSQVFPETASVVCRQIEEKKDDDKNVRLPPGKDMVQLFRQKKVSLGLDKLTEDQAENGKKQRNQAEVGTLSRNA